MVERKGCVVATIHRLPARPVPHNPAIEASIECWSGLCQKYLFFTPYVRDTLDNSRTAQELAVSVAVVDQQAHMVHVPHLVNKYSNEGLNIQLGQLISAARYHSQQRGHSHLVPDLRWEVVTSYQHGPHAVPVVTCKGLHTISCKSYKEVPRVSLEISFFPHDVAIDRPILEIAVVSHGADVAGMVGHLAGAGTSDVVAGVVIGRAPTQ